MFDKTKNAGIRNTASVKYRILGNMCSKPMAVERKNGKSRCTIVR